MTQRESMAAITLLAEDRRGRWKRAIIVVIIMVARKKQTMMVEKAWRFP
jgi:hypothetical protein